MEGEEHVQVEVVVDHEEVGEDSVLQLTGLNDDVWTEVGRGLQALRASFPRGSSSLRRPLTGVDLINKDGRKVASSNFAGTSRCQSEIKIQLALAGCDLSLLSTVQADGSLDLRVPGPEKRKKLRKEDDEEKEEQRRETRRRRVLLEPRAELPVGKRVSRPVNVCSCCLHATGYLCQSCNDRLKVLISTSDCPLLRLSHF